MSQAIQESQRSQISQNTLAALQPRITAAKASAATASTSTAQHTSEQSATAATDTFHLRHALPQWHRHEHGQPQLWDARRRPDDDMMQSLFPYFSFFLFIMRYPEAAMNTCISTSIPGTYGVKKAGRTKLRLRCIIEISDRTNDLKSSVRSRGVSGVLGVCSVDCDFARLHR